MVSSDISAGLVYKRFIQRYWFRQWNDHSLQSKPYLNQYLAVANVVYSYSFYHVTIEDDFNLTILP